MRVRAGFLSVGDRSVVDEEIIFRYVYKGDKIMMLKQTKIVASISDERCEVEFIRDLFKAGMNVVRMNTAHASREGFEKLIRNVREVSNRIAILMDTKGPEVRTTAITGGEPIPYKIGDRVKIVGNPNQETTRECIAVSYPGFVHDLQVDGDILIDDGDLELRVVDKTDEYLVCEVQNEATLGNRKSVNVPGVRINLPSLTEKTVTIYCMLSRRISIILPILLSETSRMYWIFARYWIHMVAISRLLPRLRIRKVLTTLTRFWKWRMA